MRIFTQMYWDKNCLLVCLAAFALTSCAQTTPIAAESRPANWAQPVALAGVPNLYEVSPDFYRSAQPSAEGLQNLEKLGIKTVVSLRAFHNEREEIRSLDMQLEEIPTLTWGPGDDLDEKFFQVLERSPKPILLHCQHGADRTGALSALYRIREQDWTIEDSLAEMEQGGFGFHSIWGHLPRWVEEQAAEN